MKRLKYIFRTLLILLFLSAGTAVFAQGPPNPTGGSNGPGTSGNGNQLGNNAPIGSGLIILLTLGAAYGGRKIYKFRGETKETEKDQ